MYTQEHFDMVIPPPLELIEMNSDALGIPKCIDLSKLSAEEIAKYVKQIDNLPIEKYSGPLIVFHPHKDGCRCDRCCRRPRFFY
jgi:hypothetical protein